MCKARSVDEFLGIIFEKIDKINKKEGDPFNLFWFRGESCDSCNYNETYLVPSAYRDHVVKKSTAIKKETYSVNADEQPYSYIEMNLRADFDRKVQPFVLLKSMENTAWSRYFLMQHYNVNTRLLDWTEDVIKALFFAVKEAVKENTEDAKNADAKVWILQPFELNRFTFNKLFNHEIKPLIIPPLSNDLDKRQGVLDDNGMVRFRELTRRYLTMDFDNDNNIVKKNYYPIAIYPPFEDDRIVAQKSCFTIFGDESNDGLHDIIILQDSCSPSDKIIDEIVIDGKSKKKILNQLRLIGIDDSSIYPDLDGLGNSLKSKYKDAYKNIKISFE